MLLHQDHKFIHNNVAFKIPNNVYLDACPDPSPIEGMVLYSKDQRARIEIFFVETESSARAFLEEERECYETFQSLKQILPITVNAIDGCSLSFATKHHRYEEYAFNIPGEVAELLDICIEQRQDNPTDPTQCAQIVAELLSGITLL